MTNKFNTIIVVSDWQSQLLLTVIENSFYLNGVIYNGRIT